MGPGDPEGFFRHPFSLFEPLVVLVLGLPLSIASGWLVPSSRPKGYVILTLTVVVLAYVSSFSFFGGVCLDPGEDTCVTTWPTRFTTLAAALFALAVGGLVARRRTAQEARSIAAG